MIRISTRLVHIIWVEHMVQRVALVTAMDAVTVNTIFIDTSWLFFSLKHDVEKFN